MTNFMPDDPGRVEFAQSPGTFCTSFGLSPDLCGGTPLPPPDATVTDPDDDAVPSGNEDPDPDVVSASVMSDGTDLHLSVRFKPGTFDPTLSQAYFSLDTDQDTGTGSPGTTSNCETDAEVLGVDFVLEMSPGLDMEEARVLGFSGCNDVSSNVMVPEAVAIVADGMDAVVPLAVLGGDDGLLDFKVTISEQVPGTIGNEGILDTMPDTGLPAGMSTLSDAPLGAKGAPIVNESPAKIGGIITLWANGLGPLTGMVPSGDIPEPGAPILLASKIVRVFIGGIEAQVLGAFLQSQFVALNQINAIVPEGIEAGTAVPIVIEVDCGDGNVFRSRDDVTIAIAAAE